MANPSSSQPFTVQQDDSDAVALLQLLQCLQQPSLQQPSMNSLFQDTLLQAVHQFQQNSTQIVQESDHSNPLGEIQSQFQKTISEKPVQNLKSSSPKDSSIASSTASQSSMLDTAISNSQSSITTTLHENRSPSLPQDLSSEADLFSFIQYYLTLEQQLMQVPQNSSQTTPFIQGMGGHQGEQSQGQDSSDENGKPEKQHFHLLSTPSNLDKISGGSNSKSPNISTVSQNPILSANQSIASNLNESFDTSAMLSTHKKGFARHQNSSFSTSFIPRIITYEGQNTCAQISTPSQSHLLTQDNFLSFIDPCTVLSLSALLSQQGEFTMAAVAALEAADLLRLQEQKRQERAYKIERYKNKRRNWIRKISYDCRKRVADSRLRVKGRFISKKDTQKIKISDESSFLTQENNQQARDIVDQHNTKDQQCVPNMNDGSDCPESVQTLKQQQAQYADKRIQDETLAQSVSSCELTCAASSNFSVSLKPESMDKIKSRISKKKQIFKLSCSSPIFKTTSQQYLLKPIHCNSIIGSILSHPH